MAEIYVGLDHDTGLPPERAVLVGINKLHGEGERSMLELADLAMAAGVEPVAVMAQNRDRPDVRTYIGKGKVEELQAEVAATGVGVILFDGELTPAQVRNLVDVFECKILDRTELILDIFAQHARSRVGRLQVELAQLSYLLPRLTGRGLMMDRIGARGGAGVGVRGPGETKLETDRRRLRERIGKLKGILEDLKDRRGVEREKRVESHLPLVSLVGYTNAGKSSLLNALCGSEQVVANDRLFQTLDTTVRQVDLGENHQALASDTVGFINNLPRKLVSAFRATLEEALEADVLVQVLDASDPWAMTQDRATRQILAELGGGEKPLVIALNKWDILTDIAQRARVAGDFPEGVPVSSLTGEGLDDLRERLRIMLPTHTIVVRLHIPYTAIATLEYARRAGRLLESSYEGDYVVARAEVDEPTLARLREYVVADR
jgi:GTP-binding protein HflX